MRARSKVQVGIVSTHIDTGASERPIKNLIPRTADELAQSGNACLADGHVAEAISAYRQALLIEPQHPYAAVNLGTCLYRTGDYEEAKQTLIRATCSSPNALEGWNNLGATYSALGELDQARACFEKVIQLEPGFANAHANRGNTLTRLGHFEQAIDAFEAATSLDPQNADTWCNLSVCMKEAGRYADAVVAAWRAHGLSPDDYRPCAAMGTAILNAAGAPLPSDIVQATAALSQAANLEPSLDSHIRSALAWLKAALDREPNDVDALRNVASIYDQLGDLEHAKEFFDRVLSISPDESFSLSRMVDITLALCDWQAYDAFKDRLLARVEEQLVSGDEISIDIINLIALPITNEFLSRASQRKANQISENLRDARKRTAFQHVGHQGDKLRLGYLLPYARFTSMTQALADIVARHDRDRFDVFGYCIQKAVASDFEQSFRQSFDMFRDVPGALPERAAETIHADGIDILIETTGHTTISCLPITAMRPAPVQAHYLGYGLTTGAEYMDYLITDQTFTPPELSRYCSERLVYLPYSFLPAQLTALEDKAVTRADCGLPDDGFVFCNFNQPAKFEPAVFSLWMRILESVPDSVLWLGDWNEATRANLRREAEARAVSADRLIFAEIVPHVRHLSRLQLADLGLDTLFHGGGVTSIDLLQAGVPLLTCAGETPQTRLGATLLTALELPELITDNAEAFTDTAIALAQDPNRLRNVRQRLHASRSESPLFDQDRYVRDLERAYGVMWEARDAKDNPAPLAIPPRPRG